MFARTLDRPGVDSRRSFRNLEFRYFGMGLNRIWRGGFCIVGSGVSTPVGWDPYFKLLAFCVVFWNLSFGCLCSFVFCFEQGQRYAGRGISFARIWGGLQGGYWRLEFDVMLVLRFSPGVCGLLGIRL